MTTFGPGCQKALGAKWNLYSGPTSILAKATGEGPNGDVYIEGSTVANSSMLAYGYPTVGGTVGQYLANGVEAFVEQFRNSKTGDLYPGNVIVLGNFFNTPDTAGSIVAQDQNMYLVHEVLHTYTGQGDIALASTLGLGNFSDPAAASLAISNYIFSDCGTKGN